MKKRNNKLFYVVTSLLVLMLFISCSKYTLKSADTNEGVKLTIDSKNKEGLPKHFRKTNSKITAEGDKAPSLEGLDTLNVSGSAQFCADGLKAIKDSIAYNNTIIDIDLRQESHGFINGMAVSWANKSNNANKGLTKEQVIEEENNKLKSIEIGKPVVFSDSFTEIAREVMNENDLVKKNEIGYLRIPITDREKPSNDMVDYFVEFVRVLPENTWLHFHCKHGVGRTTTFMVMYDSIKNAKKVSLEDIMSRQVLIGGKELLEGTSSIEVNSVKRSKFIIEFYRYCKENKDDFKTPWSQWVKENNIKISYHMQ